MNVSWTGTTINAAAAVLNGTLALDQTKIASWGGSANSDLIIVTNDLAAATHTFTGGASADALIVTDYSNAVGYTFSGGAGNDAFVGSEQVDDVTGGTGADKIALQQSWDLNKDNAKDFDGFADIVNYSIGDSTATAWDQIASFSTNAVNDILNLVSTTIAANTAGTDGVNVGDVKSHAITNGIVTFDDADVFATAVQVGTGADDLSLSDALGYLATNLNGTNATVAFAYDRNGNGLVDTNIDDTIVFQDGTEDTVIQLVGTTDVAAVALAAGANTIVIS